MHYEAILFDVGDTLIGYEPSFCHAYLSRIRALCPAVTPSAGEAISEALKAAEYGQLMKEHLGAPRMPDDQFMQMMDLAALEAAVSPEEARALLPKLQEMPYARPQRVVKPESIPTLQALHERGVRMGVVSNYTSDLLEYLQQTGLAPFFETIIISQTVGIEKPDPRIMALALDAMHLTPEQCLYVGDHPFDVLCAKAAGMDAAWIATPHTRLPEGMTCREDYRIRALPDLLNL